MDFHFSNGFRFCLTIIVKSFLDLSKKDCYLTSIGGKIRKIVENNGKRVESNLHANTVKYNFLVANKPNCIRKFIREVWVLH
jgi:hypothetical protein